MNTERISRPLPWNLIAIWLLASVLAALSCSLNLPSAQLNGEYLPMGNDSFYHARRILDTAHDPGSFYQFDSKIHAPEGSLLVWPWGYDYAMAMIVRGAIAVGISSDPMAILIWIPVAAVLISIALMIVIARQLGLSPALTAVATLCLALSPTTQLLHSVGLIDHHFAEFIFILAALAAGLAWLRQPENPTRALAPAIVMGLAPAIHNGLFIIQLPLLITLFVMWLQGRSMPSSSTFGIGLLITTLAILLPSLPFRMGHFEFYTLSWFHLYIAMCTAVTVVLLSRLKPTRKGIAIVLVVSAVLLIPIAAEVAIARSFLAGMPKILQMISEMMPPVRAARVYGVDYISNYYSYLLWIVPLTGLMCAYKAYRERLQPRLLFWITSLMGLALLVSQIRMHYFGSFAMYLPWLILVQEFCERSPQYFKRGVLLAALGMLMVYFPPLRHQLVKPTPIAHDVTFREIRPMLEKLENQCAQNPGIVLADSDAGHYIRYYTECPTIVNNFLLTPQQFKKVDEAMHLFTLSAQQFKEQAPQIKYVLVRPIQNIKLSPNGFTFQLIGGEPPRLAQDLFGPADALPPEFKLIQEAQLPELNNTVYARLYEIHRDARSQPAPSANDVGE